MRALTGITSAKLYCFVSVSISGSSTSFATRSIFVSTRNAGQSSPRMSEKRNSSSLAHVAAFLLCDLEWESASSLLKCKSWDSRLGLFEYAPGSPAASSCTRRLASISTSTTSRVSSASWTSCNMRRSNCDAGLWHSRRIDKNDLRRRMNFLRASTSNTPMMRLRVVCGFAVTMATFSPVRAIHQRAFAGVGPTQNGNKSGFHLR